MGCSLGVVSTQYLKHEEHDKKYSLHSNFDEFTMSKYDEYKKFKANLKLYIKYI